MVWYFLLSFESKRRKPLLSNQPPSQWMLMMTVRFAARDQSTTCLTRAIQAASIWYVRLLAWLIHATGMRITLKPFAATALITACVTGGDQQPSPQGGSMVLPRFQPYVVV